MAVQTVACPGCKATLKAPEEMAGKKAKCKKCGVSFRIPGGAAPTGEPEGDSQFLSAMDLPVPAAPAASNPFDFGGDPEPAPKPAEKEKPVAKEKEKPVAKKPEPTPAKAELKAVPKVPAKKPRIEEEDIPAAAPVEDDEPAPAASSDPFAFSDAPAPAKAKTKEKEQDKAKENGKDKEKPKEKAKDKLKVMSPEEKAEKAKAEAEERATKGAAFAFGDDPAPAGLADEPDEEEEEEDGKPVVEKDGKKGGKRNYKTKSGSGGGGTGKLIIAAVVFALIVGGIVGGVLIYLNGNKAPEQANNDKKTPEPTPTPAPPVEPPSKGDPPKVDPKDKEKEKAPGKKDPNAKKTPGAGVGMLALAPGRTITLLPQAAKFESIQEFSKRVVVVPALPPAVAADAFVTSRKVFPPLKADNDIGVVWQTEKGLQGVGEKLLLGVYAPSGKQQPNPVVFEGDGSAVPACDLSVDATVFAHAHIGKGTVTVWDTRTGMKLADAFNPYATKKDLKLAAVALTEPPKFFITVSTTGAVHAFDVNTKEPKAGQFAPTKPPAKPLVAGLHIIPGPDRRSVVLYTGGSFYQVTVAAEVAGTEIAQIGGDVGRSFGLAASGSGKLLFAFETEDAGKKEKAVMLVGSNDNHLFFRWPDKDAGEPTVAGWVNDNLAMVGSDRGSCIWFKSEGPEFKPLALARTPMDKARHVASDGHWSLLPDPANPKQCVLVEYASPGEGLEGAIGESTKQTPSALLTDKALSK